MIKKKKWVLAILLLIILFVFEVFALTPLARISTYFLLLFSTIGHFLFFRYQKFISNSITYWYWIGILLMFISILTTHFYYGQTFVSGFVANVAYYNVGSVILFMHLFLKYKISLTDLFKLLTKTGWILVVLIALMAINNFAFINESEFTGKIVIVDAQKVNKDFINFIAIYWFSLFLFKSKYKYLIYSLLVFSINHVLEMQRFIFLVTLLVIGFGIMTKGNVNTKSKFLVPVICLVLFAGIFIIDSEVGASILYRFHEAIKIFSGNENIINDSSTFVRISEMEFAIERIKLHPFFGNGLPRASEFDQVIGEDIYFHVNDIGLIGVTYAFGVFGIFVFLRQLKVLWQNFNIKQSNVFHTCMVLSLLLLMINSLLTGLSILHLGIYFFYVCLLGLSLLKI